MKIPFHLRFHEVYFRPIIPLMIAMIPGIMIGTRMPGHTLPILSVILLSTGIILFAVFKKKPALFSPLILFLCLGYLSIQPWIHPSLPPNHVSNFVDSGPFTITGTIIDNPTKFGRRTRFILKTYTLIKNQETFPVKGDIRVTAYSLATELHLGDRISFLSKIRSIRNFTNPGGFNYKRYMTFKKIWGTAYFSKKRFKIMRKDTHNRLLPKPFSVQKKISDLIDGTEDTEQRAILKALITGEKNEIPKSLRQAFNRAGISHLLAISGLHIGIVATVSFFFFSWILAYITPLLWKAWIGKGAAILTLLPVFSYGIIAGMSPSTQRAVIMVSIFMMTFLVKREQDPMNTLSLAAALILVYHPPALFSISFQLSFSAVFFIIYGMSVLPVLKLTYDPAASGLMRSRIKYKLFTFFMVSLFAVLGTLPIVMHYFNQVSLIGLFTNFFFIPVIGFVVVPVGLIAVCVLPFSTLLAEICMKTSAMILDHTIDAVYFISAIPFSGIKTITPGWVEICFFYLLLLIIIHLAGIRKTTASTSVHENTPQPISASGSGLYNFFLKQKRIVFTAIILLVVLCGDTIYWMHQRFWHKDLRVTAIDVGQGGSTLLELPGGHTILVDGGGFSDNSAFDMGEKVIAPLLWRKKIKTIDTLILSHPNSDHLNGLLFIAKHFNVKKVLSNHQAANTVGYRKFIKIIKNEKIHHPDYRFMQRSFTINHVKLRILYPPANFLQKMAQDTLRNSNNNSIVLKAEFGAKSFLIPGDLTAEAEKELVAVHGNDLKSTVLISPHHGSRTSSTNEFLAKANSEMVIISAGWKNKYHFPHPEVIKRYREHGTRIFRTDRHGAVSMTTDGRSLRITPALPEQVHQVPYGPTYP